MTLHVLEPGLCTLPVDFGRPRSRSLGVPVSGAADRAALALGNALVGNPPDALALEICLAGPTLRAGCNLACVLYGAPFDLTIGLHKLTPGATFTLRSEEVLRIGGTPGGMRAYLCVQGGLQGKAILGSHTALAPIKAGDELGCQPGEISRRFVRPHLKWNQEPRLLRAVDGPQADWFDTGEFYRQDFTILPASNRMGMRLDAEPLTMPSRELVSEPVCPGAVQVTRDGKCIVIGVDGQTIGGYPKIAQLATADLDKLGQLRPGGRICFQHVSLEEAEQAYRDKQAELCDWITRLQTAEVFV